MPAEHILLSVIIPTCNRNDALALCLDQFKPDVQVAEAFSYEVIVTDDGTKSNAKAMLEKSYSWVKWTPGPHRGPAANRNNGAKVAQGEWLVFIDDDVIPACNLLAQYVRHMSPENRAMEGAILAIGDATQDLAECPVNATGGAFWSANVAVERALFDEIGGFDETYPYAAHEDQDIYLRLKVKTSIPFIAEAIVHHPIRMITFSSRMKQMRNRAHANAIHRCKHEPKLTVLSFVLSEYYRYLFRSARTILKLKRVKFGSLLAFEMFFAVPMSTFFYAKQKTRTTPQ